MKNAFRRSYRRISLLAILMVGFFTSLPKDVQPVVGFEGDARFSIAQEKQPQWISISSLKTARFDHSATLLQNGNVLVVGGYGAGLMLSSCELYDPATGTWTVTGKLNKLRQRHTATLLKNGRVLVVGGSEPVKGKYDGTAELYDPASGTWSLTGNLKVGRIHHTATLLLDGRVLVTAGHSGETPLSSAELYDPGSGTWKQAADLKEDRMNAAAILLPDGKVLVTGGAGRSGTSGTELFDPDKNSWKKTASMSINRWFHTATLLTSGKVLVEEGAGYPFSQDRTNRSSAEIYDPVADKWTRTGRVGTDRHSHTATLLPNGNVLIAGGDLFGDKGGIYPGGGRLVSTELYDPGTGTWSAWSNMNAPRALHTATLLANRKLLVVGGISKDIALSSVEVVDVSRLGQ